MKKVLILILVLGLFGCSTKKQLVKLSDRLGSAEFQADLADNGIRCLENGQEELARGLTQVQKELNNLRAKLPEVEKKYAYIVKKGDYLWKIAQELYRNGARWMEIYVENKEIIENPNLIYINQKLIISNMGE